jgi:hypothetical protein
VIACFENPFACIERPERLEIELATRDSDSASGVESELLRVKETVPLDAIAQSLWLRMIQDNLLGGHTSSQIFFR